MRKPLLALLLLGTALAPAAVPAVAQTAPPRVNATTAAPSALVVEAGAGRVISMPAPVSNVFVSDPKVVEVRPASPTSLFLFGVAAGHTTVAALDGAGHPIRQFDVTVRPSSFGANEAAGAITRTDPDARVRLDTAPKQLTVTGVVNSPVQAHNAATTATAYTADNQLVSNQLKVSQDIQVGLHVRIAEMSRSVTRNLGINWQALGQIGQIGTLAALSGTSGLNSAAATLVCATKSAGGGPSCPGIGFTAVVDALAADNLVHVLAEPNLTAISGEPASFLVGGEFPIPVAQSGNNGSVSVEFKQYGIGLSFLPTVLSEDRIRLHVRPEVSQLSNQGAVTLNGITVPALTVRRADTTVEVGSGQSFAIAGLLSDQTNETGNAIPELGEVPVLGALFRSDAFQRQETELVIIVTPYIERPVDNPNALHLPTDIYKVPNDIERLLLMRQIGSGPTTSAAAQRVPGQAGFIVE